MSDEPDEPTMNADRPDPSHPEDPDRGLDIDAAFAEIVANWGPSADEPAPGVVDQPRPDHGRPGPPTAGDPEPPTGRDAGEVRPAPPGAPDPESLRALFQPSWRAQGDGEATWDDEGHFVPPSPPPLPQVNPRRRLAWAGLLGTPVVALLLVVLGVGLPGWGAVLLAVAFVGGFGYLVATMGGSPPDSFSGGDGAVL